MLIRRAVINFIVSLACAATLGWWNVAAAQQSPPQTPAQPSSTRPPDPARFAPVPANQFKAPESIEFRTANVTSEGVRLHAELFSLKSLAGSRCCRRL